MNVHYNDLSGASMLCNGLVLDGTESAKVNNSVNDLSYYSTKSARTYFSCRSNRLYLSHQVERLTVYYASSATCYMRRLEE